MAKYYDMLVYLRKRANLTQEEASKKIGISRSSLANYEKGLRRPNFEVMEMIADFYNVNMDTIFGHETITESKFRSQIDDMSADLWVKQQVAITDEYMETDTSSMTKEEQSVFLQQLIDKYAPYRIAPTDSSSESIASSLDQLSDNQLDDLFMQLISGKDKDYLLRLASKILEIASKN